uniref:hypothetical protein n=1 Tax=Bacteroides caecimuris TaxID=1796613 RepID=UPI002648DC0E
QADSRKIEVTARLHARITERHGAPCTDFVCANTKLQEFTASKLDDATADKYLNNISKATAQNSDAKVLKEESQNVLSAITPKTSAYYVIGAVLLLLIVAAVILIIRKRKSS